MRHALGQTCKEKVGLGTTGAAIVAETFQEEQGAAVTT